MVKIKVTNSKIGKSSQNISGLSEKPASGRYWKTLHLGGKFASDPEVVLCSM